jgi:hypothetical protein
LDIEAEPTPKEGFDEQFAKAVDALATELGVMPEVATLLVRNGLTSAESIVQAGEAYLKDIPELSDSAGELLRAAQDVVARRTAQPQGTASA